MHWTIQDWEIQDMISDYISGELNLFDWHLQYSNLDSAVDVADKYIKMIRDYESSGKTPSKWIRQQPDRADARRVIEYLKNNRDSSVGTSDVLIRLLEALRPLPNILKLLQ